MDLNAFAGFVSTPGWYWGVAVAIIVGLLVVVGGEVLEGYAKRRDEERQIPPRLTRRRVRR